MSDSQTTTSRKTGALYRTYQRLSQGAPQMTTEAKLTKVAEIMDATPIEVAIEIIAGLEIASRASADDKATRTGSYRIPPESAEL